MQTPREISENRAMHGIAVALLSACTVVDSTSKSPDAAGRVFVQELSTGDGLSPTRTAEVADVQVRANVRHISPIIVDRILAAREQQTAAGARVATATLDVDLPHVSEEEKALKTVVETRCRHYDFDAGLPLGMHSILLIRAIGAKRGELTIEQLHQAARWSSETASCSATCSSSV